MSEDVAPTPLTIVNSWFDGDLHTHLLIAPNEQPVARIKFDGVHDRGEGIWTEATIEYLFLGEDDDPVVEFENINLLASTWMNRNGILEQIQYRDQGFAWQEALRSVMRETIRQHRTAASSHEHLTRAKPDEEDTPFLIEPLVGSTGLTLWYSPPGAGKSMTALAAAVCVSTGFPMFGKVPTLVGPVIYVDAEDDIMAHRLRMNAMLESIEWEGEDPPIEYFSMKGKFKDAVRPIKRLIREHNAVMVVVDSIGQVRGMDASDGGATIQLMNALGSLGLPVLGIDHVTKEDNRSIARGRVDSPDAVMAIGSQFSTAAARLGWFFQKMTTSTAMEVQFTLHNTKHNHIPKQPPMSMTMKMTNDKRQMLTGIEFKTWDKQMFFEVGKEDNLHNMLVQHYRYGRPTTMAVLARLSGVKAGTAASVRSRNEDMWSKIEGTSQYVLSEQGTVAAKAFVSEATDETL